MYIPNYDYRSVYILLPAYFYCTQCPTKSTDNNKKKLF